MFGRDDHEHFDAAIDMANGNGFHLAVSVPCFELWLLLHFRDNPGARHRKDLQRLLKKKVPTYEKNCSFSDFAKGFEEAATGAERLEDDEEPFKNPSTSMFRLVESLKRG